MQKAIGASQRAVSYWESGVAEPNATIIYNLAVFFDVSADYLVGNGDY
ncbi:MAG: helix-turn-helix domain-containing protein [Clostridiales bacterium]|nr:MAG: helix-turn-helix domain-containing protein [Clostridiales bacterium]